jgi:hypothetical protein
MSQGHLRNTLEMLIEYDTALVKTHWELIASLRKSSTVAAMMGQGQAARNEIKLYEKMVQDLENRIEAHQEMLANLDDGVCPWCGQWLREVKIH